MRHTRAILTVLCFLLFPALALAAPEGASEATEAAVEAAETGTHAAAESHGGEGAKDTGGVAPYSYVLFEVAGLPVTNSMVTTWFIWLLLILGVKLLVGRAKAVPTRGQAVIESGVEWLKGIIEPIVGRHMLPKVFPLLITLFFFILIMNWSGLLPGVGSFGYYEDGHLKYFFRPANSDLNTTLALAILSQIAWLYFVLRYAGVGTLAYDLFGNKADKKEVPTAIFYFLFLIFIGVGFIEVISILFRTVSLPFRLYGNVYGGENLLDSMTGLFKWLLPTPFYLLELLIGFVQALVWTLLVSVYVGLICNHDTSELEEGQAH